jgi:DNA transformation protein
MFGGWGIYKEGVMFGLVDEGELFLKVGESNRAECEAMGCLPYVYVRKDGRRVTMSFWSVPEGMLESPAEILRLAEQSHAAAVGIASRKKR